MFVFRYDEDSAVTKGLEVEWTTLKEVSFKGKGYESCRRLWVNLEGVHAVVSRIFGT